jgi:hypothetical protein
MPSHPIALSEFDSGLSPLLLAHFALDDLLILVVVVLELTRGMYLQVPVRLRARVAEGVVDPSWLENERASRGDHDLASYVEGQLAFQHEGALVLVRVGVGGIISPGGRPTSMIVNAPPKLSAVTLWVMSKTGR